MRKTGHKRVLSFFALLFLGGAFHLQAVAASLGTLSYWDDAEQNIIYRWGTYSSSIPSDVYTSRLNSNVDFYFSTGIIEATNQWNGALNSNMTARGAIPPASGAQIMYYGGTAAQINALNIFNAVGSVTGLTQISYSDEGTWTYGSSTKTGRKINWTRGYVVDIKGRTANQYINTSIHELGHTVGWGGHASGSSNVMYTYDTSITSLTSIDRRHVKQLYK